MDEQFFTTLHNALRKMAHLQSNRILIPAINKVAKDNPEPSNLTQQQLVLRIFNRGPIQISKIAEWLALKRPNATRLANSLVKLGMCEKIRKEDKRHVYLALSEKGKSILQEEVKIAREHYKEIFTKYLTNKDLKQLLKSCEEVNVILSKLP